MPCDANGGRVWGYIWGYLLREKLAGRLWYWVERISSMVLLSTKNLTCDIRESPEDPVR
jgi:hypothetical protein